MAKDKIDKIIEQMQEITNHTLGLLEKDVAELERLRKEMEEEYPELKNKA